MKNGLNNKLKDVVAILTFIIAFFIVFFLITKGQYLYGSTTDWEAQHYLIPEYFRSLFYQTKDLFPDFAFHLGGGQNIYYFSYYGLLNPFILLSYLLPFVEMVDYIQVLGCIIPILSTVLFYFYLKKHTSYKIAFFLAFIFLCAGPILFHSHRHLMFINYFPFFMMALFGIDSFFEKNKITLLLVSCFLIIMTSYYYSVGSLIALFCYGIYYGIRNNKWTKRKVIRFFIPFIVAILMNMVILLPTLYTLLSGRTTGEYTVNLLDLLFPKRSFRFLLYETYALGLTSISLIATIYLLFTKKRENIFLGLIILMISLFPICNYILNGTLYINAKSLIPFLPIILIFTIEFIEKLISYKLSYKKIILILLGVFIFTNSKLLWVDLFFMGIIFFFHYKFKRDILFLIPLCIFCYGICIMNNFSDKLGEKNKIESLEYKGIDNAIQYILDKEPNIYRINNYVFPGITMNKIYNKHHYSTTLYSSTFNKTYNEFFFDVMNNEIPYRNRSMTPASSNPFFQRIMGEKYIITTGRAPFGSKKIYESGNVKVYELDYVQPIGYVSSNIISLDSYKKANYPMKSLLLFNGIVVESGKDVNIDIEREAIDFDISSMNNIEYEKNENGYHFIASENAQMNIKLTDDYKDKFLFIRLKNSLNPSCEESELAVAINGVRNKLSCATWKYHNKNYAFDYVLYNEGMISVSFAKGEYLFSDIEVYAFSKDEFVSMIGAKDEFIFDKNGTLGDTIKGTINVTKDGYFKLSIPYDDGFKAWIDDKEVEIEKVDDNFIGFKISEGNHTIKIIYEAPYKKGSLIVSFIGVLLFIGIVIYEKRK